MDISDEEDQANIMQQSDCPLKLKNLKSNSSDLSEADAITEEKDEEDDDELPSEWIAQMEEEAADDSDWEVSEAEFNRNIEARGPLPIVEEFENLYSTKKEEKVVVPAAPPFDRREMMIRRMSVCSIETVSVTGHKKLTQRADSWTSIGPSFVETGTVVAGHKKLTNRADSWARIHQNQPYDESLEVGDAEEVASVYTPTPRVPRGGAAGHSRGETPPESKMSEQSDDDDIQTGNHPDDKLVTEPRQKSAGRPGQLKQQQFSDEEEDGTESSGDDDEDDDDDDDDDDEHGIALEGAYDPADYENLPVSSEIKELFQYITRYTPQAIELEHKMKPFIPDFIPAVGDIDAFIKVPRPDSKPDTIGLTVLDEPCAKQSDPTVLDLKLRSISRQTNTAAVVVKSVENAEKNPKAIENWIDSISEIHRSKPPPNVHYTKNMPDIDTLMEEWPPEFEELLKEVSLPTADLDCDLNTFVQLVCSILDIPIHKSSIQSLHVLFTLYSEFKNSQHFKQLADGNQLDNALKGLQPQEGNPDQLIL